MVTSFEYRPITLAIPTLPDQLFFTFYLLPFNGPIYMLPYLMSVLCVPLTFDPAPGEPIS